MHQQKYKVQAVAHMLDTTTDTIRRMTEEAGVAVVRQENGPKTRQYSIDNVFELAAWRQANRPKITPLKQVIASVYAPKGGVGKTMLSANLSCLCALMGLKVLVIDLDFQANLTLALGYDSELTHDEAKQLGLPDELVVDYHLGHLVPGYPTNNKVTLADVIKKPFGEHGPHLIPSDLTLDRLDTVIAYEAFEGGRKADLMLARLIHEGLQGTNADFDLTGYDIVLFDAAPAKNRMTRGALLTSDYVISPVSMEKFSTKATSYLSVVLNEMRKDVERAPELLVVGNFYQPSRTRATNQLSILQNNYPTSMLDALIRRSEEFPKLLSTDDGEDLPPLVLAKPTAEPCAELKAVAHALLVKMGVI